jgi:hypothetical protein
MTKTEDFKLRKLFFLLKKKKKKQVQTPVLPKKKGILFEQQFEKPHLVSVIEPRLRPLNFI